MRGSPSTTATFDNEVFYYISQTLFRYRLIDVNELVDNVLTVQRTKVAEAKAWDIRGPACPTITGCCPASKTTRAWLRWRLPGATWHYWWQAQALDCVLDGVEAVSGKVSEELARDGAIALALAMLGISIYIWFRFEWQFGVGALDLERALTEGRKSFEPGLQARAHRGQGGEDQQMAVAEEERPATVTGERRPGSVGLPLPGVSVRLLDPEGRDILDPIGAPQHVYTETARRIRELGEAVAQPRIIAMTANAFGEDRDECLAAGMNDHIAKPVDASTLYETLLRWLPACEVG